MGSPSFAQDDGSEPRSTLHRRCGHLAVSAVSRAYDGGALFAAASRVPRCIDPMFSASTRHGPRAGQRSVPLSQQQGHTFKPPGQSSQYILMSGIDAARPD